MPPPPDNFPDGWENEWQPSFDEAKVASQPAPKFDKDEEVTAPRVIAESAPAVAMDEERDTTSPAREAVLTSIHVPSLYGSFVKESDEHPPRQITVVLRSSSDKEWDRRRIRAVHGILISSPGRDRFSFQIFESGRPHLIDFPNETTRITPHLLSRLFKLLGEECWQVEDITFQ
jgi:DNA polymerase-3 subunit alpha